MSSVLLPLTAYLHSRLGTKTGYYYVDSTSLAVCHNKRINRHQTFEHIATRGKTSMGCNGQLKTDCQIEHSRHRKPDNFIINLVSGLMAYMLRPKKPSLTLHANIAHVS